MIVSREPGLLRFSGVIHILIFTVICIHLFYTIFQAVYVTPSQDLQSEIIIGLIILVDVSLLVASYVVLWRIKYGIWSIRFSKSAEPRGIKFLKKSVNKNAYPYFFMWIICDFVVFIVANRGSGLQPIICFPVIGIIGLIGFITAIPVLHQHFSPTNERCSRRFVKR